MNRTNAQPPTGNASEQENHSGISPQWIAIALFTITFTIYFRVTSFDFVDIDDRTYVVDNPHVKAGLTWKSFLWAWTAVYSGNWHPLTTLSHMVDCEIFGLRAGFHHLTSLIIHCINTVLLFLLLHRATKALWRSAIIAALFALHPLHVESVAWIAERKDVLSGFFGLLTMLFYTGYVRATATNERQRTYYVLSLLFFLLGLLSKPMLVTVPFVLLLLDYWPFRRLEQLRNGRLLLLEKAPFFALTLASCIVTFFSQKSGGAVVTLKAIHLHSRISNALVSYVRYLSKTIWPEPLAVFYPYEPWSISQVMGAAFVLAIISWFVVRRRKVQPYLFTGWLWFAGMLVPVIGLIQVGSQSMADRYTYIPLVGLFIAATWYIGERITSGRHWIAITIASFVLAASAIATSMQLRYWRNSHALFAHAAEVTRGNGQAEYCLGGVFESETNTAAAILHYTRAVEAMGDFDEARCALANALSKERRNTEAIAEYLIALKLRPRSEAAHYGLANVLLKEHRTEEAITHYREAVQYSPDFAEAHYQLAIALRMAGQHTEELTQLRDAVRLKPDWLEAVNNLSWMLATHPDPQIRNGNDAVQFAEKAISLLKTNDASTLDTLAAAYAEAGRFPEAIATAEKAVTMATGKQLLLSEIEPRLRLYRNHEPYRQPLDVK